MNIDYKTVVEILEHHAKYTNAKVVYADTRKEYKVSEVIQCLLDLYNKEKERNKELEQIEKEHKEENGRLRDRIKELEIEKELHNDIRQLFENSMLGYINGYEDGRNGTTGLAYNVSKQFADYTLTLRLNQYKEENGRLREKIKELEKEKEEEFKRGFFTKVNESHKHTIKIESQVIPKMKVREIVDLYNNTLQCTRKYNEELANILCDLEELLEESEK